MRHVISATPVILAARWSSPPACCQQRKQPAMDCGRRGEPASSRSRCAPSMNAERALGHDVIDVSVYQNYQVGRHQFAKGAGRPPAALAPHRGQRPPKGQTTITVTRNEILYGLNQTDKFILAVVMVDGEQHEGPFRPAAFHPGARLGRDQYQPDLDQLLARISSQPSSKKNNTWRPSRHPRNSSMIALPLDAINVAAAARESPSDTGILHTAPLVARRPLAAARAVLFAQTGQRPRLSAGGGFAMA